MLNVCGPAGGARKPAEFLCLILKLLQIQPDKEIIIEYIKNEDYKYVRILGEQPLPLSACSLSALVCSQRPRLHAWHPCEKRST